ncbi:hypothetical protein, partial [Bradyrhizobium sp. SZCCHNRI3037]|uniref:hypothetical protein n=1 Tax=Bradyrhizobium sp. SZCCHNRI3037 TaxID=3057290 RepID=UPI002915DCEF
ATALFGSARPGGFAPPSYTTSGDTTIVGGEMDCVSFDKAAMNNVRFGTKWDSGRNSGGISSVVNAPVDALQD